MKKLVAIILLIAIVATSVIAAPIAGFAYGKSNLDGQRKGTGEFTFDVDGMESSDAEAEKVEGKGVVGAVSGAILGFVGSGVYCCVREAVRIIINSPKVSDNEGFVKTIVDDMISGAVMGAISGAFSPI